MASVPDLIILSPVRLVNVSRLSSLGYIVELMDLLVAAAATADASFSDIFTLHPKVNDFFFDPSNIFARFESFDCIDESDT